MFCVFCLFFCLACVGGCVCLCVCGSMRIFMIHIHASGFCVCVAVIPCPLQFLVRLWRRVLALVKDQPDMIGEDMNKLYAFIREFCWTTGALDGIQRRADNARMAQVAAALGALRPFLPDGVELVVEAVTFDPNERSANVSELNVSQSVTGIQADLVAAMTRKVSRSRTTCFVCW
jgi:hypothetical protein